MPVVAVALVLAGFAWHPAGLPQLIADQDKLMHLLGFATLALTMHVALPQLSRQEYGGLLLLAISAIELGQTFIPGRTGSLLDIGAGGAGALLGLLMGSLWRPHAKVMAPEPVAVVGGVVLEPAVPDPLDLRPNDAPSAPHASERKKR